ncbi:lipase family protein [Gordonia sp. NPDC003376]
MRGDLMGYDGFVTALLGMGYAVALTDYQGLGASGIHPYLEPSTSAFNVTDAVRALRHLDPATSDRWLALGISQGGQAAWSADELDGFYGQGLAMVGAVALAPAADISRIADLAADGALSTEQMAVLPMLVEGARRVDPSIRVADYLAADVVERLGDLIGCDVGARAKASGVLTGDNLRPVSGAAATELRDHLRRQALPQRPLAAPLLVANGLADQTVLPTWVSAAVDRACALGGAVTHYEYPDVGHADLVPGQDVIDWIGKRFEGAPASSNCGTE